MPLDSSTRCEKPGSQRLVPAWIDPGPGFQLNPPSQHRVDSHLCRVLPLPPSCLFSPVHEAFFSLPHFMCCYYQSSIFYFHEIMSQPLDPTYPSAALTQSFCSKTTLSPNGKLILVAQKLTLLPHLYRQKSIVCYKVVLMCLEILGSLFTKTK